MTASIRLAQRADVPAIVALLAHDDLGRQREAFAEPLPASYYAAFAAIDDDPHHQLVVAEVDGEPVGTLQLSFLPYLNHQGSWRAQVESVHVAADRRGQGIGEVMMRWAIEQARQRGCRLVQLTTDKRRPRALRFYERLGFRPSHQGLKLPL